MFVGLLPGPPRVVGRSSPSRTVASRPADLSWFLGLGFRGISRVRRKQSDVGDQVEVEKATKWATEVGMSVWLEWHTHGKGLTVESRTTHQKRVCVRVVAVRSALSAAVLSLF